MRSLPIFGSLLCVLALQLPCAAQTLKWSFQRTGFRNTMSTPQTALSMRSDQSWPVVYGYYENSLNAYSLFPVLNANKNHVAPATNWHQIGTNLNGSQLVTSGAYLQADSSSTGGFAVSVQTPILSTQPQDVVSIGNSSSGFLSPTVGAQAVTFDGNGDPFTANNSLIPNFPTPQKLFDVALSKNGDVGAISQASGGSGTLTYWQQSPLLGSAWFSTPLPAPIDPRGSESLFAPAADLLFDNASRPHVIGINRLSTINNVSAYRFDITTGAWVSSILDSAIGNGPPIADVVSASNDDGIVGAAWVNNGILKYAYLDTNVVSPDWVVTSVASTTPTGVPLELAQGVGLAFDKAGLPVISFVDRTTRQIWLAYDPPSAFGGGVTWGAREGPFDGGVTFGARGFGVGPRSEGSDAPA